MNILEITDGTTTVNLLSKNFGWCLNSYNPAIAQVKGGGVFQSSSLSEGRKLVDAKFENVTDLFNLDVNGSGQSETTLYIHRAFTLLQQAREYWTGHADKVWLKAKADCEDNPRYATIVNYSWPDLRFPYGEAFFSNSEVALMSQIDLSLEHTIWQDDEPGSYTAVEIENQTSYDGRTLGPAATTQEIVYITNKHRVANITDIYIDDGGVFSANLMDAALPFNLLPAVPTTADFIYFGIDIAVADSGPFSDLVFDIGTAGAGYTGAFEYYSTTFVSFTSANFDVTDNTGTTGDGTDPFMVTGVNSIHWVQPGDWGTIAVNGVTAYWVRFNIGAVPGPVTVPTQQNRDIYSLTEPYIGIDELQVPGDVTALTRIEMENVSDEVDHDGVDGPFLYTNRIVMGLRSISRGADFTPYINLSDEQNNSDIDVVITGVRTTFETLTSYPTGRYILVNGNLAGMVLQDRFEVRINSPLTDDYRGRFHIFLRGEQTGSAGQVTVRLQAYVGTGIDAGLGATVGDDNLVFTSTQEFPGINTDMFMDFGVVELPGIGVLPDQTVGRYIFLVQSSQNSAGTPYFEPDLYLTELILMPVDEWAGDFTDNQLSGSSDLVNTAIAVTDSLEPKDGLSFALQLPPTDIFYASYSKVANGNSILQANADQRLWITAMRWDKILDYWRADHEIAHRITLFKTSRWQGFTQ